MKLYFSPGACSLSPHIALREAGLPFDLERVSLKEKKTQGGEDFLAINPKGAVPTLRLDGGEILTEGAAIVQYIADQKPESNLAPKAGTLERYRLAEWLNYIATELHKGFSPIFKGDDAAKAAAKAAFIPKLEYVGRQLAGKPFLLGDQFTVADTYLFTILTWAKHKDVPMPANLSAYYERIHGRPSVKAALEAEAAARTRI